MKRSQAILIVVSLTMALAPYVLGYKEIAHPGGGRHVTIYPAGFCALVGLVQLVRAALQTARSH
jgi:hypothetical protein